MIVQPRLHLGRTLRFVGPPLLALLCYDTAVTVLYLVYDQHWLSVPAPLPLLGTAVALVVGFRNNAAYARWWEARALWGAVLNAARSVARGALSLLDDPAAVRVLVRLQIAYAIALRGHLLRTSTWDDAAPYLPPGAAGRVAGAANLPTALQMEMARVIARARAERFLGESAAAGLDRTLSDLANAQGGLERIKNTPMPRQYSHIPQLFSRAFCLILPLGLVHDLGWSTPIASSVVGLMFLALDQVGRNLEDPFEGRNHDVPMLAISRTVEIDLLQALGEMDVPAPVQARDGVLM